MFSGSFHFTHQKLFTFRDVRAARCFFCFSLFLLLSATPQLHSLSSWTGTFWGLDHSSGLATWIFSLGGAQVVRSLCQMCFKLPGLKRCTSFFFICFRLKREFSPELCFTCMKGSHFQYLFQHVVKRKCFNHIEPIAIETCGHNAGLSMLSQ